MKIILIVAFAMGLLGVSACTSPTAPSPALYTCVTSPTLGLYCFTSFNGQVTPTCGAAFNLTPCTPTHH
jgi:hypothetical protein